MNKNILLLDTNISAKPIYDYLLKTGNRVFVAGANPGDALAKSAENYLNIDYSNMNAVERAIKEQSIDFLIPGGNDLSYNICSVINAKYDFYNIDPLETNKIINNKQKFRKLAQNLGLHTPQIIDSLTEVSVNKAVIVKPVDAYSGHGITVLKNPDRQSVQDAIQMAIKNSKTNTYLIEEFIEGQLYSHSAFVAEHNIVKDFIVEEYCVVNEFAVDTSKLVNDFDPSILNDLRTDILKLSKELNLQDGLIHTQFISDGENFWIVEVTRRCPGDLYSMLIELSTGFPYAAYYAKPFLNMKYSTDVSENKRSLVFRHTLSCEEQTSMHNINYSRSFKQLKFFPYALAGDTIKSSPFGRIGILFGYAESEKEFDKIYRSAIDRTLYSIE